MLGDAFRQAIEINRESSFVEAASGRYNEQNPTKIDTEINELDDSFQDCDINAMTSYNSRPSFRNSSSYSNSNENNQSRQTYNRDNNRNRGYQQNNFHNRYDNNQDRGRFDNRRRPTKCKHYRNQPRTQVIFEYTNPLELMQTVRNFVNVMKVNPSIRDQFKTSKITHCNFQNEINESDIHASSLEQVQQLINKDADLVFDALVATDYIDKIEWLDGNSQQIP